MSSTSQVRSPKTFEIKIFSCDDKLVWKQLLPCTTEEAAIKWAEKHVTVFPDEFAVIEPCNSDE